MVLNSEYKTRECAEWCQWDEVSSIPPTTWFIQKGFGAALHDIQEYGGFPPGRGAEV